MHANKPTGGAQHLASSSQVPAAEVGMAENFERASAARLRTLSPAAAPSAAAVASPAAAPTDKLHHQPAVAKSELLQGSGAAAGTVSIDTPMEEETTSERGGERRGNGDSDVCSSRGGACGRGWSCGRCEGSGGEGRGPGSVDAQRGSAGGRHQEHHDARPTARQTNHNLPQRCSVF